MDNKFHQVGLDLICPRCKSDDIYILGGNVETGTIVKCRSCRTILTEDELEEKEEENEK